MLSEAPTPPGTPRRDPEVMDTPSITMDGVLVSLQG